VAKLNLAVPVRNVAARPLKLEGRYNPISCGDSDRLIELQLLTTETERVRKTDATTLDEQPFCCQECLLMTLR